MVTQFALRTTANHSCAGTVADTTVAEPGSSTGWGGLTLKTKIETRLIEKFNNYIVSLVGYDNLAN